MKTLWVDSQIIIKSDQIRQNPGKCDYLVIFMHINLNNPGEHFLQLSPLLGRGEQQAPSPMLSPDPLFLSAPPSEDGMQFKLELQPEQLRQDFIGHSIDNLSPPIPYPSNIDRMDESQNPSLSNDEKVEERQPPIRRRKEPRSARTAQVRTEDLPPIKFPAHDLPPVRAIIQFLVENSTQPEGQLLEQGNSIWGDDDSLIEVYRNLVPKFKRLRKTKQQMTKYCMRKVFKFIADRMKKDRTHNRDVDSCMKIYFSRNHNGNSFSIPFKKNSVEKTMNGNFLKRVFASQNFVDDYRDFLRQFQSLMMEDNEKKVIYLADLLEKHIKSNDFKKIESIKRLPWTREILQQTEQLAIGLLTYADQKKEDEIKDQ